MTHLLTVALLASVDTQTGALNIAAVAHKLNPHQLRYTMSHSSQIGYPKYQSFVDNGAWVHAWKIYAADLRKEMIIKKSWINSAPWQNFEFYVLSSAKI